MVMEGTAGDSEPTLRLVTGHLGVMGGGWGQRFTLLVSQGSLNPLGAYFCASRPHQPRTPPLLTRTEGSFLTSSSESLPFGRKKSHRILCV